MYIYSNHEDNSLYVTTEEIPFEMRHCDICGDCDSFIGEFNTASEARELLADLIKELNYDRKYIVKFLKEDILPYFNKNKERQLKPEKSLN